LKFQGPSNCLLAQHAGITYTDVGWGTYLEFRRMK